MAAAARGRTSRPARNPSDSPFSAVATSAVNSSFAMQRGLRKTPGSKQRHLPIHPRPAEILRAEWADVAVQPVLAAEHIERLRELLDDLSLAPPAQAFGRL